MPSITQPSDFKAEIVIAQATVTPVNSTVQAFIDKYEPRLLNALFGNSFATLFVAGIAVDPPDDRWTALLTPDLKIAIANYIYYWYMRDQDSTTSGSGTVKPKDTNASQFSALDKVFRAWYEMVCINFATLKYLTDNADTYPEYVAPTWYTSFALSWVTWDWAIDIFRSNWFFGFYRYYKIPDIFIPLSRL